MVTSAMGNEKDVSESNSIELSSNNIQRKRSLNECHGEGKKVGICRINYEKSSGVRNKRMDARSYRSLFRPKQNKGIASDVSKRKDAPSETDCGVTMHLASELREPREKEGDVNESVPVPEDAGKKLRSIDDPDTNTTVIQSNGAADGEDRVVGSDTPDLRGNQRDAAKGNDPYSDQATVVAHPHEVMDSAVKAISAPSRQVSTEELPQGAISTEIQGGDQPNQDKHSQFVDFRESENVSQLVTTHDLTAVAGSNSSEAADNGPTAEPNYPNCFEQQQQSTETTHQIFNDGCTPVQATETTHQVKEPPNHSQHQPRARENWGESSSSDIRNPTTGNNRHSLPSISNQGGEPAFGLRPSFQRVDQPSVVDFGSDQTIIPAVIQAANQLGLSNSHLSLQADPLQIELEKLLKDIEQTTKGHENLKSQLRSDCEKEIEEVVASIHCKYEAKVQDAEAIFQLKQKALNTNVNKVFLSKILADAAKTKWRHEGSMQPILETANVDLSSAGNTPAAQQNTSLTSHVEHRATDPSVGASYRPPIISSISRTQAKALVGADIHAAAAHLQSVGSDFRAVAPHLQSVRSDFRAVAPHLQSVRSDFRAAAPHLQVVGADIRATTPHLQPHRPRVSVSAPNRSPLSHSVTTLPFLLNQPSVTLPSQALPVQPPELLSQQPSPIRPSKPSSQNPHTPTQVLLPLSQTHGSHSSHPNSQRFGTSSHHSTHSSALELLVVPPNPLVSPVVPDSNGGQMEQSALRGVQGSLTNTIVPTEVVYLSDDE